MKKIIDFFKNRIVISVIGLIALSLLIWFAGPYIKFGESNAAPLGGAVARLVLIMIILLLWGLNNLRTQLKNNKQNQDLVEDLQENQQVAQSSVTNEQSAEELQQINERFTQALATLKKLKFKGLGRQKALYELPWYIIIGPPGSGKTTALINSSLDFPLADQFGKAALQGVGGTRNCDWWFTNEAVLIDTAGRYTTQDSHKVVDSSAWEGFLNLLKRNRRRRPINGAIVAISIQDLLSQTDEERIMYAKTIRTRIDELMEKLEIRFPIYLMFTKSDLVSGFTEFFEDLSKDDREQVWGISLPNAPGASQSPDFDYLDDEYQKLTERLYERVLSRMHQERDVKRRGAIQDFPQQMENLKTIVDSFVKQTFVKNRYRYQPYLRGIYFTSGTQDGTPIDRLMTSISSSFGFAREVAQHPQQTGKSYFLGHLFRSVIFPESELVGSNRRYENMIRWAQRGAYVAMAVFAVILFVVWAGSFTRNEMYMSEVKDYIAEFNAENKRLSVNTRDLRRILPSLNALGKASIVYNQEHHPWLRGMGLYDGSVDKAADKAYAEQLQKLLLPRLINYLEAYLTKGHRGGDLYSTFRAYLMFKKTEYMDKDVINNWFTEHWDKQYKGQATVRQELKAHLAALLSLELKPSKLNPRLLASTRSLLLRVPVSQRIYSRIKSNPKFTQEIDMLNQFGESVRSSYKIDSKVKSILAMPLLFTIEGYENIDLSPESEVIADIVNERWVLSDDETAKVDFVQEDLDEISKKVKDHYLSDYANHWSRLYSALEVVKFTSLKQASDVLSNFTDPVYSPLISILQVGATNTQLSNQTLDNLADDHDKGKTGKATGYLASKFQGNKVDKQFRNINQLLRESSKRPAPVNAILQKIQQLQDFMNEISIAPDPAKKAFEVARARYQSGSGNAITALRAYAKNTPQPVKDWLIGLSSESWKVVLQAAHQFVNSEWKTQIYGPYRQALAGRYPLSRSSSDELAVYDFSEFFKPAGTMDIFYQEYMKPFINTRGGWHNKVIDNYSIGLSSNVLTQLQRAQAIKRVFFRTNPSVPGLTFQLKPYGMKKTDARFTLEMGDSRISYSHGPKFWKKLQWKGDDDNTRVRIIFEDLDDYRHTKSFDGPWAWFRLQDQSQLQKTRKSNVYFVTYSVNEDGNRDPRNKRNHSVKYEIKAKSVNNPFSKNLLGSFRCPERI